MKKTIALVLIALLALGGVSLAAQWPEGRSAAQPYSHVPEVNLSQTMGYIILFPRAKMPTDRFCDTLKMYLPREDLEYGKGGLVHLYETIAGEKDPVEVCTVDFANPASTGIRPMDEAELESLMWGSGTCVEIYLPKSLCFGNGAHSYYVTMDEGCFTAENGKLKSLAIANPEAWAPVISGDYGISGLYYVNGQLPEEGAEAEAAVEEAPEEVEAFEAFEDVPVTTDDDKAAETEAPAAEGDANPFAAIAGGSEFEVEDGVAVGDAPAASAEADPGPQGYVVTPDPGDRVHFDVVIGGDAKIAVPYSENGSVEFDEVEFHQSSAVSGTVLTDDVHWGIVFLNEIGEVIDVIEVGR